MCIKTIAAFAATMTLALTGAEASFAGNIHAKAVKVGGDAMYPSRNIVQNAARARELTTLVAAVKAAGLVDTLSSPGPFTVFAPTNGAFGKLPAGTVDSLVRPESRASLTNILTYHVVPGKITAADLIHHIRAGGGKAVLKTVQGETLTVIHKSGSLWIVDAQRGVSRIAMADVDQSNGVVHVIDTVLMP